MNQKKAKIPYVEFSLAIPAPGSYLSTSLLPGTALALYSANGMSMIDYEGNAYNAENLKDFMSKARHAAGRASERYPTSARQGLLNLKEVIIVGTFDEDGWPAPFVDMDPGTREAYINWAQEPPERTMELAEIGREALVFRDRARAMARSGRGF